MFLSPVTISLQTLLGSYP